VTARFIGFRGWSGNPAYVGYLIFRTGMADDYYSEKDTGQRSDPLVDSKCNISRICFTGVMPRLSWVTSPSPA